MWRKILKEVSILTVFFQSPQTFELLDDGGEGVGDDSGHDEYGEDQYQNSGHDELYILEHMSLLLLGFPGRAIIDPYH